MDAAKKTWIGPLADLDVPRVNLISRVAEMSFDGQANQTALLLEDESGQIKARAEGELTTVAVGDFVRVIGNVRPAGSAKLIYADAVKKVSMDHKRLREAEIGPAASAKKDGLNIETMDI